MRVKLATNADQRHRWTEGPDSPARTRVTLDIFTNQTQKIKVEATSPNWCGLLSESYWIVCAMFWTLQTKILVMPWRWLSLNTKKSEALQDHVDCWQIVTCVTYWYWSVLANLLHHINNFFLSNSTLFQYQLQFKTVLLTSAICRHCGRAHHSIASDHELSVHQFYTFSLCPCIMENTAKICYCQQCWVLKLWCIP